MKWSKEKGNPTGWIGKGTTKVDGKVVSIDCTIHKLDPEYRDRSSCSEYLLEGHIDGSNYSGFAFEGYFYRLRDAKSCAVKTSKRRYKVKYNHINEPYLVK